MKLYKGIKTSDSWWEGAPSAVSQEELFFFLKIETWTAAQVLLFGSLKKALDIFSDLLPGLALLLVPCWVNTKILIENRMDCIH